MERVHEELLRRARIVVRTAAIAERVEDEPLRSESDREFARQAFRAAVRELEDVAGGGVFVYGKGTR